MKPTFEEIFKDQLETLAPCNGDYLNGRTKQQAIADLTNTIMTVILSHNVDESKSQFNAAEHLEQKIQEFSKHKNEYLVYYMEEIESTNDNRILSIKHLWSGDFDSFIKSHEIIIDTTKKLPVMKPISMKESV